MHFLFFFILYSTLSPRFQNMLHKYILFTSDGSLVRQSHSSGMMIELPDNITCCFKMLHAACLIYYFLFLVSIYYWVLPSPGAKFWIPGPDHINVCLAWSCQHQVCQFTPGIEMQPHTCLKWPLVMRPERERDFQVAFLHRLCLCCMAATAIYIYILQSFATAISLERVCSSFKCWISFWICIYLFHICIIFRISLVIMWRLSVGMLSIWLQYQYLFVFVFLGHEWV